jgi:hypothetical protein
MTGRPLRFSERKRLADTGSLGDLSWEEVPAALRNAVKLYVDDRRDRVNTGPRVYFTRDLAIELGQHFGDSDLNRALSAGVDEFLDAVEILVEVGARHYTHSTAYSTVSEVLMPSGSEDINHLFDRHRFGYRLARGEIQQIGSPVLSEVIVGPALLAVQRPGWEHVERSFREAVLHQRRSDEGADALTSAASAVESALKAAGYKGATMGDLASAYRRSPPGAGFSPAFGERVVDLLVQLVAWRSESGDAHGKAPGAAATPPKGLVDLAIHWAGAFIVYLADATNS